MRHVNEHRRVGFSLIELLVVIGIITVLIGILLPILKKAREQAQRIACVNNIHQLAIGVQIYCNENRDWYPTNASPRDGVAYAWYADDWVWWEFGRNIEDSPIAKCLRVKGKQLRDVLRCPADSFEGRTSTPGMSPASQGPYFYSYGINQSVGYNDYPGPLSIHRTKRSQRRRPAEKILFTEDLDAPPNWWAGSLWGYVHPLARRHGQAMSKSHGVMGINASAAFMDGHVAAINEDYYWNDVRQIHHYE